MVRDHASKCFMPKYKVDFRVVHIQGNKVEIKDNNGKLSWYYISDIKKWKRLQSYLSATRRQCFWQKGRLSFDPDHVKDFGWVSNDWKYKFNPDHVKDIVGSAQSMLKQRSHPMELRSRDK